MFTRKTGSGSHRVFTLSQPFQPTEHPGMMHLHLTHTNKHVPSSLFTNYSKSYLPGNPHIHHSQQNPTVKIPGNILLMTLWCSSTHIFEFTTSLHWVEYLSFCKVSSSCSENQSQPLSLPFQQETSRKKGRLISPCFCRTKPYRERERLAD